MRPPAPGAAARASSSNVVVVDAEQPADGVGDLRRVERAHEREVAAGGVGEPGDDAGRVGGRLVADRVHRARRPDRDRHVAGAEPDTERAGHVVAGARRDDRAAPLAGDVARPEHRRQRPPTSPGRRRRRRAGRGGSRPTPPTSSRCPDASPRSVTSRPVSWNVSQSCGSTTRASRRHASGSLRCSHDSLVIVKLATGTHAARLGPRLPAAWQLVDQPRRVRRRLGVVPQLGRPDDLVALVEGDHPVLLPGDADRGDRRLAGLLPRRLERRPPRRRLLLGPRRLRRRVRRRPAPDDPAAVERRGPRPWSRWSTSRRRRRAASADAGDVAGDEVLQPLLAARDARRLAAVEGPLVQRRRACSCRRGSTGRARRPSRRSGRRGWRRARRGSTSATSSARAIVSIPPMWPWNRSVRSIDWRRSLASKFSPPVVNPPPRRISSMPSVICSTETGKRSTSQPSRSSPALASIDPKIPALTAAATSWAKSWPDSVAWLTSMLTLISSARS